MQVIPRVFHYQKTSNVFTCRTEASSLSPSLLTFTYGIALWHDEIGPVIESGQERAVDVTTQLFCPLPHTSSFTTLTHLALAHRGSVIVRSLPSTPSLTLLHQLSLSLTIGAVKATPANMPPKGLYAMPRHHLYGGPTRRHTYSTNDFQPSQEKPAAAGASLGLQVDGAAERSLHGGDEASEKKKKKKAEQKKKKKKHSSGGAQIVDLAAKESAMAEANADVSDGKSLEKNKKKYSLSEQGAFPLRPAVDAGVSVEKGQKKRHSSCEAPASSARMSFGVNTDGTPAAASSGNVQSKKSGKHKQQDTGASAGKASAKKRKRDSGAHTERPSSARARTAGFVVGNDLVDNVKASLAGFNTPTKQDQAAEPHADQPSKKKARKEKRKSGAVSATATHPIQDGLVDERPKDRKDKKRESTVQKTDTIASPNLMRSAQKTPVPLPTTPWKSAVGTGDYKIDEPKHAESDVIVPETPPSRVFNTPTALKVTPVPFPVLAAKLPWMNKDSDRKNTARPNDLSQSQETPKRRRREIVISPPSSVGELVEAPATAPATLMKASAVTLVPSVPNALTDANLKRFKEPLKDAEPKKRAKGAKASSAGVSIPSSQASIEDAFARVRKPYASKVAEKAKQVEEKREEASFEVFEERFRALRRTVNFTEELNYLSKYLEWDTDRSGAPIPCLQQITGCTHKKEEILRLSREENLPILGHADMEGANPEVLYQAANRAQHAEELLTLSLKARIPVPIGRLEGTWSLYCPKYAEVHFDRFGYGQRTLSIASVAGFRSTNSYTARLQLPPRSMTYTILAFQTPPHASFRTTTVRTAAEGYEMDIAFLGNGYLQLRVDLKLMLRGRGSDKQDGRSVVMDFIGVHEKAVDWLQEKNELEEVGRKLFAKYDGKMGDD